MVEGLLMVGTQGHSGGRRPGAGGRGRPPYRKPLSWPKEHSLETREKWLNFINRFIQDLYESKMDARTGGCLNNALRLYGDGQSWITKAPLQIIQAQIPPPGMIHESDLAELLSELPEDARRKLWERAKELRLRRAVSSPGQS